MVAAHHSTIGAPARVSAQRSDEVTVHAAVDLVLVVANSDGGTVSSRSRLSNEAATRVPRGRSREVRRKSGVIDSIGIGPCCPALALL